MYDLKGAEYIVGMVVDNLPPVDNTFSGLYHPISQGYAAKYILFDFFRHVFVVRNVFSQEVIDVARLQDGFIQAGRTVVDDKFVSRLDRKEVAGIPGVGYVVFQQVDPLVFILFQIVQLLR